MKRPILILAVSLVAATTLIVLDGSDGGSLRAKSRWEAARPAGEPSAAWRRDAIWDDGQAEFAAYEVQWRRYGRLYSGRALMVTVKEPWRSDREVKADRERDRNFDVIKLNHIRSVETGIYRYEQMASVFRRRQGGELQKVATSSAEACGLSTAFMTKGRLQTRSYFDGEGQAESTTSWPETAIPEDGLPLFLRDWVSGQLPSEISVFPSLLHGRFPSREAKNRAVRRRALKSHEVPAGEFEAVAIEVGATGLHSTWVFEAAQPHRLLEANLPDGTRYRLAKCERMSYWNRQEPVEADWWPKSLR